jgi:hypothetical protein
VVTIAISPAAFEAKKATLPPGSTAYARPDGKGSFLVALIATL